MPMSSAELDIKFNPETEIVSEDLTRRGIACLENNPEIDKQILQVFKERGYISQGFWFELTSDDELKVNWGKNMAEAPGAMGSIYYERFIKWVRRGQNSNEMGFIGYKKGQHGMMGGLPDQSRIRFASWDNEGNTLADFEDDFDAYSVAEKFISELETLN